ncbi:hypothetical protein SAMN05444671_4739 [Flavobacterium sp. CF108]|nr:hypothetical protein SAMN04487978_0227 [Flavobacterium sp. fv08]SHI01673.1 hypothetical protein SAMN05444671_4739 [Flavobacterium sp. CF108]
MPLKIYSQIKPLQDLSNYRPIFISLKRCVFTKYRKYHISIVSPILGK